MDGARLATVAATNGIVLSGPIPVFFTTNAWHSSRRLRARFSKTFAQLVTPLRNFKLHYHPAFIKVRANVNVAFSHYLSAPSGQRTSDRGNLPISSVCSKLRRAHKASWRVRGNDLPLLPVLQTLPPSMLLLPLFFFLLHFASHYCHFAAPAAPTADYGGRFCRCCGLATEQAVGRSR